MTGSTQPLDLEISEGVARLTLNRPDDGNAIDLALANALRRAVGLIADASPRVVIVGGAGGSFSAGGDVREMAAADDLAAHVRELAATFHHALADLSDLDAVIIAAVDGVAAGGGFGLALSADILIASDRAIFRTAYEAIGLVPDSGTSFLLPRAIGLPRAQAMSAMGVRLDAATAAELGLVHQVVPAQNLPHTVGALAGRIASKPQSHMAATRRLYRGSEPHAYRRHLDAETQAISAAAASADGARLIGELATRSARAEEARRRRAERAAA